MKKNKLIIRVLVVALAIISILGSSLTFAEMKSENKTLQISRYRYLNGSPTNGYAYNTKHTLGSEGTSNRMLLQIISTNYETNFYCLAATAGTHWNDHNKWTQPITYTRSYDLSSATDRTSLKSESSTTIQNLANSKYMPQILWILGNMYVPSTDQTNPEKTKAENLQQKQALLAKAGLIYSDVSNNAMQNPQKVGEAYKYKEQPGYEYNSKIMERHEKLSSQDSYYLDGYCYYDSNGQFKSVELTDDLIAATQQAALWYFTNGLQEDGNIQDQTFDISDLKLFLSFTNGKTDDQSTDAGNWPKMEETKVEGQGGMQYPVYAWQEEQAAILSTYLIDAANNYAKSIEGTENPELVGNPLTATLEQQTVTQKTVGQDSKQYYVVGPIKIQKQGETVYDLSNEIKINNNTVEGTYISNAEGVKQTDQTVANYIGKDNLYVAVPKESVTGNNIAVSFSGTYKKNNMKLWVLPTGDEQPIVEVTPKTEPLNLTVSVAIEKQFDLALRKAIIKITDAKGNVKLVSNEEGALATRNVTYVSDTILENGTATYNHRKDPVVVAQGDVVTYAITVYNEGDMKGYAGQIIDKLPAGLKLKGYTSSQTTTGNYTSSDGNVSYSYTYNPETNEITFTNTTKKDLAAYSGVPGSTLSSETIEIECEVTQKPSAKTNTYLTNIAYISKEYNTELEEEQEVVTDRDSHTDSNPTAEQTTEGEKYTGYNGGDNKNGPSSKNVYTEGTNNESYFPGKEDDDDFEIVVVQPLDFDLALQKFISGVYSNGNLKDGRKEPTINTSKLASGEATTATYTQDKTPIRVKHGDYVKYTFMVYNEGEVDGYVDKITDNIPSGLQFVYPNQPADGKTVTLWNSKGNAEEIEVDEDMYAVISSINSSWSIDQNTDGNLKTDTYNSESTISITCDVNSTAELESDLLLSAYDSSKDNNNDGSGLDRVEVTLILRVEEPNGSGRTIRNEAAITEAKDTEGNKQDVDDLTDRDSQIDKWPGKDGDKKYQDDEDYDNVILGKVDLALSKFIAAISDDLEISDGEYITEDGNKGNENNPYLRATRVDTTELKSNPECHDATYYKVKDPIVVPSRSYVLYDIRVYNEGEVDVYAGKVTDHLPEYLDYVDCEFNKAYGWEVASDGKTISTEYLSHTNQEDKLLKAFDKEKDNGAGSALDYEDLQVLCRVSEDAPTNKNIVNVAEITEYEDENGDKLPDDIDSTPDNVDEKHEDDDDYEQVLIKTFDLSLLKYVSTVYVTEDGKTTTTQTGNTGDDNTDIIPKVEINRKKIDSTIVRFGYTIKITNEGDIAGYAKEITDYVPAGLKFYAEDNNGWTDEGNNVISTRLLENTLLQPGESATVTVIFRWINGSENLGLKTNTAEISEDYNDEGVPDKDSTPDNKEPEEDDIDDAQVLLSISTGLVVNVIKYVTMGTVILIVLAAGIIAIKKFVL